MSKPIIAYKNILETSTVTLTAATQNASFPLYRIYDYMKGFVFKPTAAETIKIRIDQGASPIAIDRLLLINHNLDGVTLDFKHSTNGTDWTNVVDQWVQSGNGIIDKPFSSLTKQYLEFIITSPGVIPYIGELFLPPSYEWEKDASRKLTGALEDELNMEHNQTSGGYDRFIINGDDKKQRNYGVYGCGETQRAEIEALWKSKKPFFLCDHAGTWIWGFLRSKPEMKPIAYQKYAYTFNFLEVLQ